jgi:hypothetical protein
MWTSAGAGIRGARPRIGNGTGIIRCSRIANAPGILNRSRVLDFTRVRSGDRQSSVLGGLPCVDRGVGRVLARPGVDRPAIGRPGP